MGVQIQALSEFIHEFLLVRIEGLWNLDEDFQMKISSSASFHRGQPSTRETEDLSARCSWRYADRGFAIDGGYTDVIAERGLPVADGNRAEQICAAPLEKEVFVDVDDDVEVSRLPRSPWVIALASEFEFLTGADSLGNPDLETVRDFGTSRSSAWLTAFDDDAAGARTMGALTSEQATTTRSA